MRRTRRPVKCFRGAVIGTIDAECTTGGSCLDSHLNRRRKGSCLGDRPVHRDVNRISRSRKGARAAAGPLAETVTGGWRCTDGDTCASGSPAARGTYLAPCPSVHGQVILGAEFRGVGRVVGWGNGMRDGPAVTPATKVVAHTCATVLRRSGRNGVR